MSLVYKIRTNHSAWISEIIISSMFNNKNIKHNIVTPIRDFLKHSLPRSYKFELGCHVDVLNMPVFLFVVRFFLKVVTTKCEVTCAQEHA